MLQELKLNLIKSIESERESKLLIYVHNDVMSYKHIPILYSKLKELGIVENLDIFIHSEGGDPQAAYKIVKMCRAHCSGKLSIIVPLKAKSTATLLSLGTDEIVMGPSSELGPIDPRLLDKATETWGSTLFIRDSIDYFEERMINSNNTDKTSIFLLPIIDKLHPFLIGENERIDKNAKQYATMLLKKGMLAKANGFTVNEVVKKLTESYYPHSYAIDNHVAKHELLLNVVSCSKSLWDDIWSLFCIYNQEMESDKREKVFIETAYSIQKEFDESYDYELYEEDEDEIFDVHKEASSEVSEVSEFEIEEEEVDE